LGIVSSGIAITTAGDKMSVAIHCDEVGLDPDEFLKIFIEKFNEAIKDHINFNQETDQVKKNL